MMNKRIFATLVAMGMVASMGTMVVSADTTTDPNTGGASSAGNVEAIIDMEVVTATLPTSTATDTELNFTMDPQELIEKSGGGSLSASSLTASADNTLLFANTDGGFSNTSDELTIKAYNSVDADITVAATYSATSNLVFSSTSDFGATIDTTSGSDDENAAAVEQKAADEVAHIYLAMKSTLTESGTAGSEKTTVFTADGVKLSEEAKALASDQFKVTYTAGDGGAEGTYSYAYDTGNATDDNTLEFSFTGATNPDADWTGLEDGALNIDFVWSVKKHVDSYLAQTSITSSDLVVEFSANKPEGVTVESAYVEANGSSAAMELVGTKYFSQNETGMTFSTTVLTYYTGVSITVKFTDGQTQVITIQ